MIDSYLLTQWIIGRKEEKKERKKLSCRKILRSRAESSCNLLGYDAEIEVMFLVHLLFKTCNKKKKDLKLALRLFGDDTDCAFVCTMRSIICCKSPHKNSMMYIHPLQPVLCYVLERMCCSLVDYYSFIAGWCSSYSFFVYVHHRSSCHIHFDGKLKAIGFSILLD